MMSIEKKSHLENENGKSLERTPLFRRLIPVLSGALIMMCLGTVYSWSVFRLAVQAEFGIGMTASGLPYMLSLAFYAVSMLLTGRYLSHLKPRHAIWLGGALVSIGWIAASFAGSIAMLSISYGILIGAGVGIAYGAPMEVAARCFPHHKGLAVGMVLLGFGMSPLVTAPLVRMLLARSGLSTSFLLLGISFAVLIPVLAIFVKAPEIMEGELPHPDTKRRIAMIGSSSFPYLYATFLIGTTIGLMTIGLSAGIGTRYLGLSPARAAALISLFAVFNGVGRPLFGWLSDHIGPSKTARLSYTLIALASILMLVSDASSVVVYAVSFSLFWLNLGGWLAIAPTTTIRLYGLADYARNYGLLFTAYGGGAIAGVLLSGAILDLLGSLQAVFILILILAALGLVLSRGLLKDSV